MDLRYLAAAEALDAVTVGPSSSPVAPGKISTTSRLAPRPQQIVFRVESAEAAAAFAGRFGPRDGNGVAAGAGDVVARADAGGGAPLSASVREKFEGSLGADLSAVRVHTGAASTDAAGAVGARAYTTGNDIHFGAGQYAPDDPFGLHLLAHEVAHTQQQGGGGATTQYKLEVSSPTDAAEVEADRAADAMVIGAPVVALTSLATGAMRSPLKTPGGPPKLPETKSAGFSISRKIPLGSVKLSIVEVEGEATVSVDFKPKGGGGDGKTDGKTDGKDDKPGASKPVEIKTDVAGDGKGNTVKLAAEKELDVAFKPKLVGELEWGPKGPKGKIGFTTEREGFKVGKWELFSNELSLDISSWDFKGKPKWIAAGWKVSAKFSDGTAKILGQEYDVNGTLSVELKGQPLWEEIGRLVAQRIAAMTAAQLAGAAAAAALPIAAFIGGLMVWARAGHEFDEASKKITNMASTCRAAAAEAITGTHEEVMFGGIDLAVGVGSLAKDVRAKVAASLGVPEGALAEVAKAKPKLPNMIYAAAWNQKWPPLKAALLVHWQDTLVSTYKNERRWLDSFERGEYAPHDFT